MRLRAVLGVAAVLMLVAASDALAQRGGGRFGRGLGGGVSHMGLLRVEKVQQEIDLTDEQQEQIRAARRELRQGRDGQQGGRNFRDLSDQERQELIAQRRQRAEERAKAEKEKLGEILSDEQTKRLGEIYIQVAGAQALESADVVAALKITDEQKGELETARDEAQDKRREAFGEIRDLFQSGDREAIQEKMAELRKETDAIILAVLTDEQKQEFEQMKGEAIELTQEDLGRASGFGGRGRGGQQDDDA